MTRVPPSLAYLVIYNPTLQPNPEDSTEGRDEDDVTEQAHILFYTARERAVSRDRILRQVGLAKALANFSEMFTSQPGFDNVHAQKSRLIMVSPEPNFWIHACINLAKTPKATAVKGAPLSGTDAPEEFEYHSNSLNDEILRSHLIQGFQSFKLQHGGFSHLMQLDGVQALERRIESFFTPWAWQWNLSVAPDFGSYIGPPVHPLKKQLSTYISEYVSRVSSIPTIVLSPPHIITAPNLSPITPLPPLAGFLEKLVPIPKPKRPSPSVPESNSGPSTSKHMLAASGHVVTKYITKPAVQVVDPRNWSWPTYMSFGKGSMRGKDKERAKIPTIDTNVGSSSGATGEKILHVNKDTELLGPPIDQDAVSKASRSVSPSTVDHESLLDAQMDARLELMEASTDSVLNLALRTPLPGGSNSDGSAVSSPKEVENVPVTPRAIPPDELDTELNKPEWSSQDHTTSNPSRTEPTPTFPSVEAPQAAHLPLAKVGFPADNPTAPLVAPELAPVQVQLSTRITPETTSGSLYLWLNSANDGREENANVTTQKQRVAWIAIPGLLVASILKEEDESTWNSAAQELLFSLHETIQSRQLTAAETTLRALSTTKVVAHYPAAQLSASSVLPQFTSESPQLFASARALQFSTVPTIREVITQTRWGTWCAARQSTLGTRLYLEVDRKDANLVDVDQELGSACRRWDDAEN